MSIKPIMRNSIVFVLALFSAVCAFSDDDLVANGSFEIGTGNIVDHWSLFIMTPDDADAPKAEGRVDDTAFVGTRSVMLTHPQPYKKEPYNNWSQQVFGPLAGKKLHLSGQIRTENASGASIWLQCWRKRPLRLLYVAETRPVTDTREWTLVETDLTVPEGTDFAMLRCVLRGKGTAWFDDVKVVDKAPPPAEPVEDVPAKEEQGTA